MNNNETLRASGLDRALSGRTKRRTILLSAAIVSDLLLGGCETQLKPLRIESIGRECFVFTVREEEEQKLPNGNTVWTDTSKPIKKTVCFGDYRDSTINTTEPPPIGEAKETYEKNTK